MSYSTVFSIMVKPPGFFFQGGHSDSDDEDIFFGAEELNYGPPSDDLRDMMESRSFVGGNFDSMFDETTGGVDFDSLFESVVTGTLPEGVTMPNDIIDMNTVGDIVGGEFDEMFE